MCLTAVMLYVYMLVLKRGYAWGGGGRWILGGKIDMEDFRGINKYGRVNWLGKEYLSRALLSITVLAPYLMPYVSYEISNRLMKCIFILFFSTQ